MTNRARGCGHGSPQWNLASCNEDGWRCGDCEAKLGDDGFAPALDREHTREKVGVVLLWLHEQDFMYVSNATGGDYTTARVAMRCHAEDTFDQQSIIRFLIEENKTHAEFWRTQAKQAMCSHPSRGLCTDEQTLKCHACGHESKIKTGNGPLFSEDPF